MNASTLSTIGPFNPTTPAPGTPFTFATSPVFVSAAQVALDGNQPLEMILFAPGTEAAAPPGELFIRWRDQAYATVAHRPKLTVDYTPPSTAIREWQFFDDVGTLCGVVTRQATNAEAWPPESTTCLTWLTIPTAAAPVRDG